MSTPTFEKPLPLPLSREEVDRINKHLVDQNPQAILRWAIEHIPGLFQTTAFGLTGLVSIDILSKITPNPPPLIFIDTLYHFPETYELVEEVTKKYDVPVHIYKPKECQDTQDFEAKYGERLWEKDETAYDYHVKVEPARRAYDELGVKAVITGRRASQGSDRAHLQPFEVDETGLIKLNPLFNSTFEYVEGYIKGSNIPHNKLLDQGYRSVGDRHSTVKSQPGDGGERAGRWAGKVEKTECGLHQHYYAMKAKIEKREDNKAGPAPSASDVEEGTC